MNFLLDTNILIPAEPTSPAASEVSTPLVTEFLGLNAEARFQAFVHPASVQELAGDGDFARRTLRNHLLSKYVRLPSPPLVSDAMKEKIGKAAEGSHDAIDDLLLASVVADAIDFLVTSDRGIHRKAARLGVGHRVLTISDAIATVRGFIPSHVPSSHVVALTKCHSLNSNDSIFASLRGDYPGFDDWLRKSKLSHRDVFLIDTEEGHAALAIIKDESPVERGFSGKTLKICTFKVAEHARGRKYGELLLRAVFDFLESQDFAFTYLTCFPKQYALMRLLRDFGFYVHGRGEHEIVLAKCVRPSSEEYATCTAHEYNLRFGPNRIKFDGVNCYAIPIQPRYHAMLFPAAEQQRGLFDGQTAFGNAIRKAYLCRSPTRSIPQGSVLLFYRSEESHSISRVGVADGSLRTRSKSELMRFVGQRTVYSEQEIEEICESGGREVLAILFREAKAIDPITIDRMREMGALNGVPQSVTRIRAKGLSWLKGLIEA